MIPRARRLQFLSALALAVLFGGAGSASLSLAQEPLLGVGGDLFVGQTLVLKAEVEGGQGPFHYQWFKDYMPLPGGTGIELRFDSLNVDHSGVYWVTVFNDSGSTTSPPESIQVRVGQPSRLANVSVVGLASDRLTMEFTLGGNGTSGSTEFLTRAAGPALTLFNVAGALPDPVLSIFQGGQALFANDNWGDEGALAAAAASVGAFAFPSSSNDSALLLPLGRANYLAEVVDGGGGTGMTMVELYDTRPAPADLKRPRLVSISTRAVAGIQEGPLTAGFTIEGELPLSILLRGLGPALGDAGIIGAMTDPKLSLFRGATLVASNENWGDTDAGAIEGAQAVVGAMAMAGNSLDAAIFVPLTPGSYTVQLSTMGESGMAQVEVHEVQ